MSKIRLGAASVTLTVSDLDGFRAVHADGSVLAHVKPEFCKDNDWSRIWDVINEMKARQPKIDRLAPGQVLMLCAMAKWRKLDKHEADVFQGASDEAQIADFPEMSFIMDGELLTVMDGDGNSRVFTLLGDK